MMPNSLPMFLFLSVGAIALFSFIAVASWSDARRREREAYYKTDLLKKLSESPAANANAAIELLHAEERSEMRKKLEGMKLGGLIVTGVGIALMIFLFAVDDEHKAGWVGLVPFAVGVALLLYSTVLAPKEWR